MTADATDPLPIPSDTPERALGIKPGPEALVSTSVEPKPKAGLQDVQRDDPQVVVQRAKQRFKYIMDVESRTRQAEREDQRFVHVPGAQWNDGIRSQRMTDIPPRPVLEFDQTNPYIKRVVNDIRQSRPAIKIRPNSNGATLEKARIREGLIRAIWQQSNADAAVDLGTEFAVTSGRGYWRIVSEYESESSFNQKLCILPVESAQSAYLDPDVPPSSLDHRYGFIIEYLDKDTFEREWPRAAAISWDAPGEDRYAAWWNGDKVAVADYYELVDVDDDLILLPNGQTLWASDVPPNFPVPSVKREKRTRCRVDWYKLTDSPTPLDRYDWRGHYVPIIQVTGECMLVDGERMYKGVVRRIRDPQMMLNYWLTAATERIALVPKSPIVALAGKTENHPEWKTANIQNHAVLEYDAVELPDGSFDANPPERQGAPEPQAALVQMIALATDMMHGITGIQPPALGEKTSPHQSGVALAGLQAQSDIVTFNYPDNVRLAIRATGVKLNDLIPAYYDAARILQIVKPDGKQMAVAVNQPTPDGPQNDITVGIYDVDVDSGPSYQTARRQSAQELDDYLELMGQQNAPMYADLRAKIADWPDGLGDEIAARAFALLPPAVQQATVAQDQDPAMAPAKAAISGLQQQLQQLQQQAGEALSKANEALAKAEQEKRLLEVKLADRTMERATDLQQFAAKMRDSAESTHAQMRGDTLEYLSNLRRDVLDAVKLALTTPAAVSGATGAVESITANAGALPPSAT